MSLSYLPATTESIAQALEAKSPSEAISILYRILDNPSSSPEALCMKEQAITNLTDLLRQENRAEDLRSLLTSQFLINIIHPLRLLIKHFPLDLFLIQANLFCPTQTRPGYVFHLRQKSIPKLNSAVAEA